MSERDTSAETLIGNMSGDDDPADTLASARPRTEPSERWPGSPRGRQRAARFVLAGDCPLLGDIRTDSRYEALHAIVAERARGVAT